MADSSNLALATNIITAPNKAFAELRERSRALLPVLVLIVGASAVSFSYISKVDLAWMMDAQLQQAQANNAQITDAQRKQVADAVARIPPAVRGTGAALVANTGLFLVLLLSAAYYKVVSLFTRDGVRFGQWFMLTCWCRLPVALGFVATIVNLTVNDARFMLQDSINPLSFGNLLSIDPTSVTTIQRALLSFDITALWTIVLAVLGYQVFARCSLVKAATIVLAPLAVVALVVTVVTAVR
jgi:hypothetical protein